MSCHSWIQFFEILDLFEFWHENHFTKTCMSLKVWTLGWTKQDWSSQLSSQRVRTCKLSNVKVRWWLPAHRADAPRCSRCAALVAQLSAPCSCTAEPAEQARRSAAQLRFGLKKFTLRCRNFLISCVFLWIFEIFSGINRGLWNTATYIQYNTKNFRTTYISHKDSLGKSHSIS